MTNSYNGYANYPTWCVKLWIDNNEGSYFYWRSIAKENRNDIPEVARLLQEAHEDSMPDLKASAFSDLLSHSLGMVDWYEIAETLVEELN